MVYSYTEHIRLGHVRRGCLHSEQQIPGNEPVISLIIELGVGFLVLTTPSWIVGSRGRHLTRFYNTRPVTGLDTTLFYGYQLPQPSPYLNRKRLISKVPRN